MSFFIKRFDPDYQYSNFKSFNCELKVIDDFFKNSLRKQVRNGVSVGYALLEDNQPQGALDRIVGFYTVSNFSISLTDLDVFELKGLPKTIPSTRLIMLGVNAQDQGKGFGKDLLNHALDTAKTAASYVGSYGVYLDADAGAVKKCIYQNLGFKFLKGDLSPEPSPMYLPMSAIA